MKTKYLLLLIAFAVGVLYGVNRDEQSFIVFHMYMTGYFILLGLIVK